MKWVRENRSKWGRMVEVYIFCFLIYIIGKKEKTVKIKIKNRAKLGINTLKIFCLLVDR